MLPDLDACTKKQTTEPARLVAAWTYQAFNRVPPELLNALLAAPETIDVPNVLGKPRNEATKILEEEGFRVRAFGPGNFTVQAQTPSSDKKAKIGSTVTLAGF